MADLEKENAIEVTGTEMLMQSMTANNNTPPEVTTKTDTPPVRESPKEEEDIKNTVEDKQPETKTEAPKSEEKKESALDWKTTFGEEYDSPEKIKQQLERVKELQDKAKLAETYSKIPEHERGLLEFIANGGDKQVYIEAMSKNYDELDGKEVIKQAWMLSQRERFKEAGLTKEEQDALLETTFNQQYVKDYGDEDYDEVESVEFKAKQKLRERDEKFARAELKAMQAEALKTPAQKEQDNVNQHLDNIEKNAKDFKELKIKVGSEELTIKNTNPQDIIDFNIGKQTTYEDISKAAFVYKNLDNIIKTATEAAKKQAIAEFKKTLKNPQFLNDNTSPAPIKEISEAKNGTEYLLATIGKQ